jgi:ribosome biogenesis GTPase / thiamine phosphate phosphatase
MTAHVHPGLWDLGWSPYFNQQLLSLSSADGGAFLPARVTTQRRGEYTTFDGEHVRAAQLSGRLRHELGDEGPCVGDFVLLSAASEDGPVRIDAVLERKSWFRRKLPGASSRAQAVAANVDVVFVVCALTSGSVSQHAARRGVNPRRIERYLHAIREAPALAVVLLNKADLCADASADARELAVALAGPEVLPVSAHGGLGLDAVVARIGPGDTALLVGSSGAGKSSLTNRLLGSAMQRVEAERAADGRGRHTTTERALLRLPSGGVLIDTPGMRELGLYTEAESSPGATGFDDIDTLAASCRYRDCRHESEPGCAVREAVASGELEAERVEHARRLDRELSWQKARHDQRLRAAERKACKVLSRAIRMHKRARD